MFLPDAREIGERKRRICAVHGLVGMFPLDGDSGLGEPDSAAIFARCFAMMRECDAIIANLTPFRSVSADPGTAFELGFMVAAGKALFGYTNAPGTLLDRVRAAGPVGMRDGRPILQDGSAVEDFGLFDNLMIGEALRRTGEDIVAPGGPVADPARDLSTFERCVGLAATRLL